MNKKLLCLFIISLAAVLFASCSCFGSNTVETAPPKTVEITPDIEIGEYAGFVTDDTWINEKTGDTISFNDDGTFSGKIDRESYSGTFTLQTDKEKEGRIIAEVTLDNKKKPVEYTIDFKTSSEMTITTDKGIKETYVAKWTAKN